MRWLARKPRPVVRKPVEVPDYDANIAARWY